MIVTDFMKLCKAYLDFFLKLRMFISNLLINCISDTDMCSLELNWYLEFILELKIQFTKVCFRYFQEGSIISFRNYELRFLCKLLRM